MIYNDFREAGIRVFGLHPINNGVCGCGDEECPVAGKHPYTSSWQHSPVWSDEQVEVMEMTGQFDTGYGVLCKGLIVVDVDARNGGIESYDLLLKQVPELEQSGLVVFTGSGGGSKHLYFNAPDGVALMSSLPMYKGIDFKSSGYVVGPGSLHMSGARYEVEDGHPDDIGDAPEGLIALLKKSAKKRVEYSGTHMDVDLDDLRDMCASINNNDLDYDTWISIGMALHMASNGDAEQIWEEWSATSPKHEEKGMHTKWKSFNNHSNPVTIGTLIHFAEQGGWVRSISCDAIEPEKPANGLPCDVSGIDLRRPPGFIGLVTDHINAQCRRPRENLAVAAALTGVGNVAGLRFTDERDGVACNLFCFCVAGSRSGKEAVLSSVSEIHRVAGVIQAEAGTIKSEVEIIKNLVEHQAAFYVIDEVGYLLQKIRNAMKGGGASHHETTIATLMSAYGKYGGYLQISGDVKRGIKEGMFRDIARFNKLIDDGDGSKQGDVDRVLSALSDIDNGLKNPFLSLYGGTTPETFNDMVDHSNATNGFIGRSLLFIEHETVPKAKRGFKKKPMPQGIENKLRDLYAGGYYDPSDMRVDAKTDKMKVPSTKEACDLLDAILDWLEDTAENQKESSGLEALVLGAYELVSKVSLILAVGERLRTVEHVTWAFALIKRDIEEKIKLVVSNDRKKDAPALALRARISGLIAGEDGETLGVINNRCRGYKKEDVANMIKNMVDKGELEEYSYKHPKNGRNVTRYRTVK